MRKPVFLLLASLAGAVISLSPAAAYDFPYCIQGRGWGVPGDCSYRTYAECMATASGRDVYCNVNPRYAFERQQRRGRRYRDE